MNKKLDVDNWDKHDDTSSALVAVNQATGLERCLTGAGWAEKILEPTLSEDVPVEIGNLFEVARGAMVYGWFYYPMFTLGSQHLYFVHDAATVQKCEDLGSPQLSNFNRRIDWLSKHRHISSNKLGQWRAVRELRNGFAHAKQQSLFSPDMAVSIVWVATDLLNELFSRGSTEGISVK